MTTSQAETHRRIPSAFGAYIRALREAAELSQEDVCAKLKALGLGLSPSTKDLYNWEHGFRRPSSVARAGLIHVLAGSPEQADELIVADAKLEAAARIEQDAPTREQHREVITAHVARGITMARTWAQDQSLRLQRAVAQAVPIELMNEVDQLLAMLYQKHPPLTNAWIAYGQFLVIRDKESLQRSGRELSRHASPRADQPQPVAATHSTNV
jgi:transcriptional regulator with XRE-family HTH domain